MSRRLNPAPACVSTTAPPTPATPRDDGLLRALAWRCGHAVMLTDPARSAGVVTWLLRAADQGSRHGAIIARVRVADALNPMPRPHAAPGPRRLMPPGERLRAELQLAQQLGGTGLMPLPIERVCDALVLPPLTGETLERVVRRRPRAFWKLADEALRSVAVMHQRGAFHLDLDPASLIYLGYDRPRAAFALPDLRFAPSADRPAALLRAYDALRLMDGLAATRVGRRRLKRDPDWMTVLLRRNVDPDALRRIPELEPAWLPHLMGPSAPSGVSNAAVVSATPAPRSAAG